MRNVDRKETERPRKKQTEQEQESQTSVFLHYVLKSTTWPTLLLFVTKIRLIYVRRGYVIYSKFRL